MLIPSPLKWLLNGLLIIAIFTAVGQIRVGPRSLENHYHDYVNSDGFQTWFFALARPITWTGEKITTSYRKYVKKEPVSEAR
jgi:hypothetical protein